MKEDEVEPPPTPPPRVVRWFWEVVGDEFSQEQKARLLQFVTGTSGVPVEGFKVGDPCSLTAPPPHHHQPDPPPQGLQGSDGNVRHFCLQSVSPSNPYPRAHACFNRCATRLPLAPMGGDEASDVLPTRTPVRHPFRPQH